MTRRGSILSVATAFVFGYFFGDAHHQIASLNLRELWTDTSFSSLEQTRRKSDDVNVVERAPKLGDGCYHVYLDVGSNIGVHARFLFEPLKYRRAHIAHSIFDKHFGNATTRDNRDFCVFAFEPNPVHIERHAKLAEVYGALGWRYVPIPAGVADKPGNLTFYRYEDGGQMEWGFSTVDYGNAIEEVTSSVLRLSDWIRENIEGRQLPEQHSSALPPKVVMKMDIEGLEVRTMTDMLLTGVFCNNIDYAFGEYHDRWSGLMDTTEKKYSQDDQNRYWKALMTSMDVSENCRGYMEELDDEKYLTDRKPLPEVPSLSRLRDH